MSMQLIHSSIFLLLLITKLAVAAPPLAKNNCTEYCGNVSIPYPFGIGSECSLNASFEISCEQSLRPVLTSIQMEVLEVLLKGGSDYTWPSVRVRTPIISQNCSGRETNNKPVNLTGTPFLYSSSKNIFVAAGCDNRAVMVGIEPAIAGCETGCSGKNNSNSGLDGTCDGKTCCKAAIPYGLQSFDVRFERKHSDQNESEPEGCKLAFLVEIEWFNNVYDLADMGVPLGFPTVLWWETDKRILKIPETSKEHSCKKGEQPTSITCFCSPGYEGNPYIHNGCQDIDECKEPNSNPCGKATCVNRPGSYACERIKFWMILGISLGIGVMLLFIGGWRLYKFLKDRRKRILKKKHFKQNGGLLLQQQMLSSKAGIQKAMLFSSRELDRATDHFNKNRILGQGGQGTVYKGMLVDGRIVAVKKSIFLHADRVEQFVNEVVILSQIDHRNVVKLLGCCLETEVPLLVYEFISNGTLFQYLHDEKEEFQLSWKMRLGIAIEAAEAISYLHSSASFPIYHRDIKSTNILLDERYRAKVSDFGTSRSLSIDQTHVTTNVRGTFGYLDPEYFQSSQFTEKSDVYSFGVVLVELITGQKPTSVVKAEEGRSLATHFIILMQENRLFDIVDARIMEDSAHEEIIAAANIAYRCLSLSGKNRPTMKEVAAELERIPSLQKASNVQQTHEELENVITDMRCAWDAASTSTGSTFGTGVAASTSTGSTIGTGVAASFEVEPLIYSHQR
ncbi:hypothetical protein PTKIN_Ptkin07bG0301400 [Pterospermum kingtungense]